MQEMNMLRITASSTLPGDDGASQALSPSFSVQVLHPTQSVFYLCGFFFPFETRGWGKAPNVNRVSLAGLHRIPFKYSVTFPSPQPLLALMASSISVTGGPYRRDNWLGS